MFKIGYRTIKTALGATVAIIIAQLFGLDNFASAGILAILCIQVTKKKSLKAARSRFFACVLSMAFSSILFAAIAYHPVVIGLILLLFIPTTVALKVNEGIVTSCVIILHFYSAGKVTLDLWLNEVALITIGIGVALIMNLYMPSLENKLISYQEEIEKNFSAILMEIVNYLRTNDSDWDGREITETNRLLAEAKSLAFRDVENHFFREEDIYYHYFKMREKQFEIIERILPLVTNIPTNVKQSGILAQFIGKLSENVHPQNTAIIYLRELEDMRGRFKEMDLPVTREEFESRAALLQLMKEIERYLELKHSFKGLPVKTKGRMKSSSLA
ncbi:aromatic acid exporter family protein [Peribacillus cavernae]|uniref:Aromatic acid exporter family protein n=1 Tax=Peribacillus cavernae TaxID=1674310 RepID=A0A3S0V7D6_9BACI|nr:aromatic acid exporter family protein [Peribacillus cavernae]MDQ0220767.1 uncharacterized membrane protein YgaE (UPF0421/DUF939 family) [Peribacillus cavernae]RUQ24804.1 aromatic acid exporter family protein [Peribacillus cavernae]